MKAEHCRSLDVNRLHREGCLRSGWQGNWQWTQDGERVAWIGLRAAPAGVALTYRIRSCGDDWQDVSYTVPLAWTPCTKGGARPFFLCPGSRGGRACKRRVAKLYAGGAYFLCRHCYGLTYASRSEEPHDRLIRRRDRLRRTLDPAGEHGDLPPRPKGMWRRTYEAKLDAMFEAEDEADVAFMGWFASRFRGTKLDTLFEP